MIPRSEDRTRMTSGASANNRGTPPGPDGVDAPPTALVCQSGGVEHHSREASMGQVSTIGLDLAKSVFQVHAADASGAVVVRKRLRRSQVRPFLAAQPHSLLVQNLDFKNQPQGVLKAVFLVLS